MLLTLVRLHVVESCFPDNVMSSGELDLTVPIGLYQHKTKKTKEVQLEKCKHNRNGWNYLLHLTEYERFIGTARDHLKVTVT